jgi:hypothetical protein
VVLRALAKDPNARPGSADELDRELAGCLADVSAEMALAAKGQRSADMVYVAGRPVPRSAAIVGGVVLIGSLLVAAIAIGTSGSGASASTEPSLVVRTLPTVTPVPATVALPPPVSVAIPATRSVVVSSEPPGAEVWQSGAMIGATPMALTVDPAAPPPPIELHLAGHDDATLDLASADGATTVTLTPHRVSTGPRTPRTPRLGTGVAPPSTTAPPPSTTSTSGYERFD